MNLLGLVPISSVAGAWPYQVHRRDSDKAYWHHPCGVPKPSDGAARTNIIGHLRDA
jgi:hypothetical protein